MPSRAVTMLRETLCATESTAQHGDNDGGGDEEGDSPCTLTTTNLACFLHSSHIECSCMCPHLRDTSSSWVFLKISVQHAYVHHTIQSVAVDQSEAITEVQNESVHRGGLSLEPTSHSSVSHLSLPSLYNTNHLFFQFLKIFPCFTKKPVCKILGSSTLREEESEEGRVE